MHIPVLQKEVIEYFEPKQNENFIDATVGSGGHSLAILEKNGPEGKVLGIDQDFEQIKNIKYSIDRKYKNRLILVCDNFINLKEIVKREKFRNVSGILFDLGFSSWHLEKCSRGFSFLRNEPLDMRYGIGNSKLFKKIQNSELTAEKLINYYSFQEIEKILREYGEEKFSKKIAQEIIKQRSIRPITSTFQLVEIIKRATPSWYKQRKIHCATKTFQAIRIAINDELNNLKKVLPQTIEILKCEGKIVIISFHSLEDRIVKNFFQEEAQKNILTIITKKPVVPSKEEIKINPRSRSAKLRMAIKICHK